MKTSNYDLIIVGAGPCGVMAAIETTKRKKKVLLIDKNEAILKKLAISGNGRCNLTNNKEFKDFIDQLSNKKFLYSTIKQFDPQAIITYFTNLDVPLKEEDYNRIFPVSNDAKTIINALSKQLNKTDLLLNTTIKKISKKDNKFIIKLSQNTYQSTNLLLACGGQTYAHIGGGSNAYDLALNFNHTLSPKRIEECPIKTKPILKQWQGITLNKAMLSILDDQKVLNKLSGSLIFTHFGLSGPLILNSSFDLNKAKQPRLSLNLLNLEYEQAKKLIYDFINEHPTKYIKQQLTTYLPSKLVESILSELEIIELKNSYLNKTKIKALLNKLTNLELDFKGFYQPEYAFLTGSGINLNEINPKTLESKLVSNLYFGGEILDGCGPIGGYNISIALSCGHLIGQNIS